MYVLTTKLNLNNSEIKYSTLDLMYTIYIVYLQADS